MFVTIMNSPYTSLVVMAFAIVFPWFYPMVQPILEYQQMQ